MWCQGDTVLTSYLSLHHHQYPFNKLVSFAEYLSLSPSLTLCLSLSTAFTLSTFLSLPPSLFLPLSSLPPSLSVSGGILLFSKEAIIDVCKKAGLHDITSGLIGGFGGGVAQVSVLGPCTFLVTASVTGEWRNEEILCVTGVMWGGLGCCLCGVQRVWYVCAVWYDIAQCGLVIAQALRIMKIIADMYHHCQQLSTSQKSTITPL